MSKPIKQVFNIRKFDPNNTGFTFGCKVILNPDIFSKEERSSKNVRINRGTLNYPISLLDHEFKVIGHSVHEERGEMIEVVSFNPEFKNTLHLVLKDCILVE